MGQSAPGGRLGGQGGRQQGRSGVGVVQAVSCASAGRAAWHPGLGGTVVDAGPGDASQACQPHCYSSVTCGPHWPGPFRARPPARPSSRAYAPPRPAPTLLRPRPPLSVQRAGRLPVHFHIGVTPQKIEEVMHSSLVQWHLTGIELEVAEDPASEEHFGISIAEGGRGGAAAARLAARAAELVTRECVAGAGQSFSRGIWTLQRRRCKCCHPRMLPAASRPAPLPAPLPRRARCSHAGAAQAPRTMRPASPPHPACPHPAPRLSSLQA